MLQGNAIVKRLLIAMGLLALPVVVQADPQGYVCCWWTGAGTTPPREPPPVNPNAYYLATNGNDSNPGTLEQPFATFTQAALLAEDYEELALDSLATGQAIGERARRREHSTTGPRLFEPGE